MAPQNPQHPYQPPQPNPYPQPVVPQPQPTVYPQPTYPQPVYPQGAYPQPAQPAQPYPTQPYPAQPYPAQQQPPQVYPQQAYSAQPMPAQPYAVPNQPVLPNQPLPTQSYAPNQPIARAQPFPAQPMPAQPRPVQPMAPQPIPVQHAPQVAPTNRPQPVAAAAPAPARPIPASVPRPLNAPVPVGAAGARPLPVSQPVPSQGKPKKSQNAEDDEENQPAAEQIVIRKAPPWLVSAIVHALFLIVAGLIYFSLPGEKGIQLKVIYAEDIGVQLDNTDLTTGLMEPVEIETPALSLDTNPVELPDAAPPTIDAISIDGLTASSDIPALSIGLALSGREKGMKSALLGKYGGNATTEEAVKRALEWLKRNQEKDGTWSLVGPYSGAGQYENKTAATAMALLAFQGAGNTHTSGEFKAEVAKGWTAFRKMQDKDGMFQVGGVHNHRLYAQAQATIAICELYGMTKDKDFKQAAQKAIDYAVKAQDASGGWRYMPGQDADTSVTGWFVMALQSGLMAGLEVPSPTLDKISKYLDSVALEDGTRYTYRPGGGDTPTMTAEALLCRQYLGWAHEDPRLLNGVNYVNENPIDWSDQNVYYWYYATQATHHMEGEHWNKWNAIMRQTLPEKQEKTGKEAGSWSPANDRWGDHGGRLFTTCLCTYMLEVYYRHLPIYKYRVK